jgi:hypothetical protein
MSLEIGAGHIDLSVTNCLDADTTPILLRAVESPALYGANGKLPLYDAGKPKPP